MRNKCYAVEKYLAMQLRTSDIHQSLQGVSGLSIT